MQNTVSEAGQAIEPLHGLHQKQGEMTILRSAWPFTRVSHLLRAVSPDRLHERLLQELDIYTRKEIERMFAVPLTTNKIKQMFLPISFGALGLKSGKDKLLQKSLHRKCRESISKGLVRLTGLNTVECTALPANCIPINGAQNSFEKLLGQAKPHDRSVLMQARDPHTGLF